MDGILDLLKCPHVIPHKIAVKSFLALFYFAYIFMHYLILKLCVKFHHLKWHFFVCCLKLPYGIGQLRDFPGTQWTVTRCSASYISFYLSNVFFFPPPLPIPEHQQIRGWSQGVPTHLLLTATSLLLSQLKCQLSIKSLQQPTSPVTFQLCSMLEPPVDL